jgi:LmbE family N-acetylglucosaminyl deacetylase
VSIINKIVMSSDFPPLKPKVVLGIAAHPDDLDFGAAGTMAAFAEAGAAVHYLILTDGSKGSNDPDLSSAELIKIRETEQKAAVKAVGGQSVQFLDYPDGQLEVSMQLKKDIIKAIRTLKPEVVITMDPSMLYSSTRGFINHPDHRAAGQAALDAVFPLARDHLAFPELYADGYQPHKTKTVLLINFESNNFIVDITKTFDKKIAALKAHASQVPDIKATRGWLQEMASSIGDQAGYKFGEAFVRIDLRS